MNKLCWHSFWIGAHGSIGVTNLAVSLIAGFWPSLVAALACAFFVLANVNALKEEA